ncbi:MAG: bifunctional 4-hydroxy-2-oxoglutarate aldolase/2-dehydro-3-deoxy-phosphogluconate aldolase [Pseudomonadota bacterium]
MLDIDAIVAKATVIPVIELDNPDHAAPLANAFIRGGIRVAELTLRTSAALDAVASMKAAEPDLVVGMGTITTPADIYRSKDAGADFLVSPGLTSELASELLACGLPSLPGVATAGEAMAATSLGFEVLKFFPAKPVGGLGYLKALSGPLPKVRFCPTGGIGRDEALDFLSLPNVVCVGGSWLATRSAINEGRWEEIETNARFAATLSS